jgi:hypothetical protein
MKNKTMIGLALAVFGVALLAGIGRSQIRDVLTADIPFSFTVERTTLPAGTYTITQSQESTSDWTIADAKGAVRVIFLTEPAESVNRPGAYMLEFDSIGGRDFLSSLWLEGDHDGFAIAKSAAEKSMLMSGKPTKHHVTLHKKGK